MLRYLIHYGIARMVLSRAGLVLLAAGALFLANVADDIFQHWQPCLFVVAALSICRSLLRRRSFRR